jgi:hypothetical protein
MAERPVDTRFLHARNVGDACCGIQSKGAVGGEAWFREPVRKLAGGCDAVAVDWRFRDLWILPRALKGEAKTWLL